MAKASRVSKFDKEYDSYSDVTTTTSVEMVLSTGATNRAVPIPDGVSFIEVYGSADFRISLSTSLAAKTVVTDTNAVAGDFTEGNFVPANTLVARQLPATTSRILYVRSATAGCTVQINVLA